MYKNAGKMVLFPSILVLLFLWGFMACPQEVAAATTNIKYSPLFEASLQNTIREFDEKESGEYIKRLNDAVTEKVSHADYGDTETKPEIKLAYNIPGVPSIPSVPSVPSYTSSYSCGATCGSTCGATCTNTCGATCGSTCTTTCTSTCISTCHATCSTTCGSTCYGMSTCQGSSTCVGNNTCAGSNTCYTATCFSYSTCSGASTCNGTSTCTYGSGVCLTPPSSGGSSGSGSSSSGSSGSSSASDPIPETPETEPTPSYPNYGNGGDPSEWAKYEVDVAISYNFVPLSLQNSYQSNITRKEFCTLVVQFLNEISSVLPGLDGIMDIELGASPFTDVNDNAVTWAYYLDIVNGVGDGRFNPDGNITRQEAAVMLTNLADNILVLDTGANYAIFNDADQIADWGRNSVDFVYACGMMSGVGNNNFGPLNLYTREQSMVTVLRMFKLMLEE